jgi:hypothetical protein
MWETGVPQKHGFKVGDRICGSLLGGPPITGTVIEVYGLRGELRYVVRCDDGSEAVFFENEIYSDKRPQRSAPQSS